MLMIRGSHILYVSELPAEVIMRDCSEVYPNKGIANKFPSGTDTTDLGTKSWERRNHNQIWFEGLTEVS